jgi:Zn-finger nucleic acid-binding protein
MNCPTCSVALATGDVRGIAVFRCPTCHGFWIGEDGFRQTQDDPEAHVAWLDFDLWKNTQDFGVRGQGPGCPSCAKPLHTLEYADTGVDVDYCSDCRAVWMGAEGLDRVVTALEAELAHLTAGELLQAAVREGADIVRGPQPLSLAWRDLAHVLELLKRRVLVEHPQLERMIEAFPKGPPFA